MKISLVGLSLCLATGLILMLTLSALPKPLNLGLLALLGLSLVIASCWLKSWPGKLLLLASLIVLSLSYGCFRAQVALEHRLSTTGHYQLTGVIDSVPIQSLGYSRVDLRVLTLIPLDVRAPKDPPKHIRLSWYSTDRTFIAPWHSGETWRFDVKLRSPRSTYNPASFDEEAWFLAHSIDAVGYISDPETAQLLKHSAPWRSYLTLFRAQLAHAIWRSCANNAGCAQVQALSVGERSNFTRADWQLLQATGTNHLFAIAGLHIGIVAAACFWLGKNLWRRIPQVPLYLAAPTAGWWFALLSACAYSALAGFALPTQRACLTLAVILIARLSARRLPPWHGWALALLIILVWHPLEMLDSSIWLSFGTVALLIYCYANRSTSARGGWREFIHLQGILSLGLWPLTAFFFSNISLSSFIANSLAIPWVAIAVMPLCLFGTLIHGISPSLASGCWRIASVNLTFLKHGLAFLSKLPYSQLPLSFHTVWLVVLSSFGILVLMAPKAIPGRWLGFIYCAAALFWPNPTIEPQSIQLSLLDVGQGLSVLVQTTHHTLVFDTGSRFSEQADMGERVVIPALKANHVKQLDALVISHGDNDHAGGAASIWASLTVIHAYTSDRVKLHKLVPQAAWQACVAGLHWQWDGVNFQFLYPPSNDTRTGNDHSCVLKITTGDQSVLLTGDIEKASERYLIGHEAAELSSTVLIVPHHGSKTSSTAAFLDSVQPKFALFPLGYQNRFHFPHPSVIARYRAMNIQLYDTAQDGQIQVTLVPGVEPHIIATRRVNPPFWRVP